MLKLFNRAFFVEEEPDRAIHEATVLDVLDAVDLLPFYRGFEAVDGWGDPVRRDRLEGFVSDAARTYFTSGR